MIITPLLLLLLLLSLLSLLPLLLLCKLTMELHLYSQKVFNCTRPMVWACTNNCIYARVV